MPTRKKQKRKQATRKQVPPTGSIQSSTPLNHAASLQPSAELLEGSTDNLTTDIEEGQGNPDLSITTLLSSQTVEEMTRTNALKMIADVEEMVTDICNDPEKRKGDNVIVDLATLAKMIAGIQTALTQVKYLKELRDTSIIDRLGQPEDKVNETEPDKI